MSTYLKLFCKMILLFLQVEILCVAGRPVALLHTCYQKQWGEGGSICSYLHKVLRNCDVGTVLNKLIPSPIMPEHLDISK